MLKRKIKQNIYKKQKENTVAFVPEIYIITRSNYEFVRYLPNPFDRPKTWTINKTFSWIGNEPLKLSASVAGKIPTVSKWIFQIFERVSERRHGHKPKRRTEQTAFENRKWENSGIRISNLFLWIIIRRS